MFLAVTVSLLAAAYNNIVNRWEPFHGAGYVPLNLAFAGTLTVLAIGPLELSRSDLGLRADVGGAALALGIVAMFALGAFLLAASRHGRRIADQRVAHMRGGVLAFYVLVRIPFGTALTEELVFRGVLFALWLEAGVSTFVAALCASLVFGLWHIAPTMIGVRVNDAAASARLIAIAVLGAIVFTTIAGLGFTWLRIETGSLIAPIVLHAGVNSVGALAAVRASSAS